MKNYRFLIVAFLGVSTLLFGNSSLAAQRNASLTGTPVQIVVTASARHGQGVEVPDIHQEDVLVLQGRDRRRITEWVPAQGGHSGLDLLLLLDDSSRLTLSSQMDELGQFIIGQPTTTFIAVGYMRNGTVDMVQNFTADHGAAANALRAPQRVAAGAASPYLSISDVLMHWPANPAHPRREILLMSDGVDPAGDGAENLFVDAAIQNVQRSGIAVFSIYTPGGGRDAQQLSQLNWGKSYLSMISQQSGGETFYLGIGSAISFAPFLDNLSQILNHQYLLTFLAQPQKKAGFQKVKVSTEIPNVQLIAANQVYVPAAQK